MVARAVVGTKPCRECQTPVSSAADRCSCGAVLPGRPLSVQRIAEPFDYSPFVRALSVADDRGVRLAVRVDLEGMVEAHRAASAFFRQGPRLLDD